MTRKLKKSPGFTLVEIMVVVGILAVLIVIFVSAYMFFQSRGDLGSSAQEIIFNLRLTQSKTMASESQSQYGIYFDDQTTPDKYVLFKGADYATREVAADSAYNLPIAVEIYSIDLSGGKEAVFKKITGASTQAGSISLRLKRDHTKTKTIYIESSGRIGETAPAGPSVGRLEDSRHVHFDYSRAIDINTEKLVLTFDSTVIQEVPIIGYLQGGQIAWEGEVPVNGSKQEIKIHTHRLNSPDTQFCVHRDRRYNNKSLTITISGDITGNLIQYSADGSTVNYFSLYVANLSQQ